MSIPQHTCTDRECPYQGQPTFSSCRCHKTPLQMLTEQRDALRKALEIASGVLAVVAADVPKLRINFTGKWARLGSMTVSEALDQADTALEPQS